MANANTMSKISAGVAITEDDAAELDHDAALYGPGEEECNAAVWTAEQSAWDALGETDVLRRLGFDAPPEVLAARAEARARFGGAR